MAETKFEVSWVRTVEATSAVEAATDAGRRLQARPPDPSDFFFRVRRVPDAGGKTTRTSPIFIDPDTLLASGPTDSPELVEDIIQAAESHGRENEPDHEVGDLQDALRLAWARLSPQARRDIHKELAGTVLDTWLQKGE